MSSRWGGWFAGGLGAGALAGLAAFALVSGSATGAASGSAAGLVTPRLVEESASSGVRQVYDGGFEFYVGGGVAAFDCDDDGKSELYLAGGANPAALYRNESPVGGALKFSRVSDPATDLKSVTGAYPLDMDSDGMTDLAVLRVGEDVLLRGLGGCRFERANERWAYDGGDDWTAAFSATWEEGQDLPTLAVGNYLGPAAADGSRACVPGALIGRRPGRRVRRARRAGARGMHVVGALRGLERHRPARPADGQRPALHPRRRRAAVAGRPGAGAGALHRGRRLGAPAHLGHGHRDVGCRRRRAARGVLVQPGRQQAAASGDGPEQPAYEDVAIAHGVTAHRPFLGDASLPSTAWHPEFADVNDDGRPDLYVSKGNVDAQPDHAAEDPSNLLLAQEDGTFVERARQAGLVSLGRSRGAVWADLNLDGMLDLVEVNRSRNVRLWRNVGVGSAERPQAPGHWVELRLAQDGANRDAVGAWLEVRTEAGTQRRQVTVGGGHASGHLGWVHVGLGAAESAEVRVRWPDGETGPWQDVEADTFGVVERGADRVRGWEVPR